MKKILLLATGSIAAVKLLELVTMLSNDGFTIRCLISKSAQKLIDKDDIEKIEKLCDFKVDYDMFDHDMPNISDNTCDSTAKRTIGHIELSRWADMILVAPASANKISELRYGLANDTISTILIASPLPIMIAPAMNPVILENVKESLEVLKDRGIIVIDPEFGHVKCGDIGYGRLAKLQSIVNRVKEYYQSKPLLGRNIIVSTGGTVEPIDSVRVISNKSSGEMGIEVAKSLSDMGAKVHLVYANISYPLPSSIMIRKVQSLSSSVMLNSINHIVDSIDVDVFISVAAVSDFVVDMDKQDKIEKQYDENGNPIGITLKLIPNADIIKTIASSKRRPKLVFGFSAQSDTDTGKAFAKLKRKAIDGIFLNDIKGGTVFGNSNNHIHFIDANGSVKDFGYKSKKELSLDIAKTVCDYLKIH